MFPSRQRIKGTSFFTTNWDKGQSWYRSHFALAAHRRVRTRRDGTPPITGEATPYYLFHPLAPERAAAVTPDARIVAILRDPVDRAYSHYRERARHGAEMLSFEEALAAEEERLEGEESRIIEEPGYVSPAHEHLSYVAQGRYASMLERWYRRLPARSGPRPVERGLRSGPRRGPGSALRFPRVASVGASTARAVQLPPRPIDGTGDEGRTRRTVPRGQPEAGVPPRREPERMGDMTVRAARKVDDPDVSSDLGWLAGLLWGPDACVQIVGAGFDAPTGSDRFALVGGVDTPRFLIPLASRPAAVASLRTYNALRAPVTRALRGGLAAAIRLGAESDLGPGSPAGGLRRQPLQPRCRRSSAGSSGART